MYLYLYLRYLYLYLRYSYLRYLYLYLNLRYIPVEVEEDEAAPGGYLDGFGWDTGLGYWR